MVWDALLLLFQCLVSVDQHSSNHRNFSGGPKPGIKVCLQKPKQYLYDNGVSSFPLPEMAGFSYCGRLDNPDKEMETDWFFHKSANPTPTPRNVKVLLSSSPGRGAPRLCSREIEESRGWQL